MEDVEEGQFDEADDLTYVALLRYDSLSMKANLNGYHFKSFLYWISSIALVEKKEPQHFGNLLCFRLQAKGTYEVGSFSYS